MTTRPIIDLAPPRLVVDLGHPELPIDAFALDHDVDQHREQPPDIVARQVLAALAFLHEQSQLLEGEARAVGMNGGDRAGVAGVDVADVVERGAVAQLLQQDAIGPHAQAGFEQLFRADLGEALRALRIEQPHMVWLGDDQLRRVFDGDHALMRGDPGNQRLR